MFDTRDRSRLKQSQLYSDQFFDFQAALLYRSISRYSFLSISRRQKLMEHRLFNSDKISLLFFTDRTLIWHLIAFVNIATVCA